MSHLPVISGKKLIKTLEKCGYYVRDQNKSHIHLRSPVKPPLNRLWRCKGESMVSRVSLVALEMVSMPIQNAKKSHINAL